GRVAGAVDRRRAALQDSAGQADEAQMKGRAGVVEENPAAPIAGGRQELVRVHLHGDVVILGVRPGRDLAADAQAGGGVQALELARRGVGDDEEGDGQRRTQAQGLNAAKTHSSSSCFIARCAFTPAFLRRLRAYGEQEDGAATAKRTSEML